MKNRGVVVVAFILTVLIAIAGSAQLLVGKTPGTRLMIPMGNVASTPAYWHYQSQSPIGGQVLYMYLRKEDHFPIVFRTLQRLGVYPSNTGLIIPTAQWLVLNMDADEFFRVSHQLNTEKIEVEILSEDTCLIVDSRVDPRRFRSTPVIVKEYPLPLDVQQRYPQYFATASSAPRK